MKMFCIKEGEWRGMLSGERKRGPKYGEECTVLRTFVNRSIKVLVLREYPDPNGFWDKWFIPLSNIDETEMIRENIKEKI